MNFVKLSGCLFLVGGVACSIETPRVDQTGLNQTGTPGVGLPVGTGVDLNPCAIDTRTVVENQGHFIEVITSRGRLFEFENGAPIQAGVGFAPTPGYGYPPVASPYPPVTPYTGVPAVVPAIGAVDLMSIPLYAQGPCAGFTPGACVFDTHAFVRLPGNRLAEYITANGRQWVFENNQMTGAGLPLQTIPRYQQICGPVAATGAPCIFDTRVFLKIGNQLVESITAYGRRFELNLDGAPLPNTGMDLMQSPRYAAGPCQGAPPGACILETRTFEPGLGGQLVETITSRGFLFTYLAETGADVQPPVAIMMAKPHWTNGPCR
jgi:hypothetical protein